MHWNNTNKRVPQWIVTFLVLLFGFSTSALADYYVRPAITWFAYISGSPEFGSYNAACQWAATKNINSGLVTPTSNDITWSEITGTVGPVSVACNGLNTTTNQIISYAGVLVHAQCPSGSREADWMAVANPGGGYIFGWGPSVCLIPTPPPKNNGPECLSSKHPINITNGNKWLHEVDVLGPSFNLSFNRYYNSRTPFNYSHLGAWMHSYARSISTWPTVPVDSSSYATLALPDGKKYTFHKLSTGAWISDADVNGVLTELKDSSNKRTGWQYNNVNDEVEAYDVTGKLISIQDRSGHTETLAYSDASTSTSIAPTRDLLISITNELGRQVNISYITENNDTHINRITNAAGGSLNYVYSAYNNLSSITYPDNKTTNYLYGEAANISANPNAGVIYTNSITGIIDENGDRYATYRYDAAGRAYDEELAPDIGLPPNQMIDHNNMVYNVDASGNPISTDVTDARGSVRTYNFTTILGTVKSTGQSQPGGSGCSAAASALTYDANGNVASRTDFDGHKTTYVYDLTRNLETSRTEGLTSTGATTTATRTITTTWHPTWRLPLVTSEYTGATATGTALHTTTNVYDTKGNITSISEADPARALTRTTTITYTYSTVVPGLIITKVVNGPRTDVTDTTTYNYYDAITTCTPSAALPIVDPITGTSPANLGCRGQLQSMTNALGKTTQFNRYNHHGQLEQLTDANGVVTTNTYDLRQRLLSHKVGNETTSLAYDNVGQVIQLTMPDASTLNYTYDAAHRLTQIQDTVGNKVTYTLDAAGNRTNEATTDPLGNLAKTLMRSYDALNRLQQVTGVQ